MWHTDTSHHSEVDQCNYNDTDNDITILIMLESVMILGEGKNDDTQQTLNIHVYLATKRHCMHWYKLMCHMQVIFFKI